MKLIAEVGSNWKTFEDIEHSILEARRVGADAVKFQLFSPKDLYGFTSPAHIGMTPYLDPAWIGPISLLCDSSKIEFMCTGFSSIGYKIIDPFVQTHKVASAEITDPAILDTVNSFEKPVYLSTGGSSNDEIKEALKRLQNCQVTIFYCVTDYPAKIVDLRHITLMRETFGPSHQYGYSDHSIDVLNIPYLAMTHGATVLEKHVNFAGHTDTDDAPHALNAQEFALMTRRLAGEYIALRETFRACPWRRKRVKLSDGTEGYYRPRQADL